MPSASYLARHNTARQRQTCPFISEGRYAGDERGVTNDDYKRNGEEEEDEEKTHIIASATCFTSSQHRK